MTLSLSKMSGVEAETYLQNEDFGNTVVAILKRIIEETSFSIDNKVLVSSLGFLVSQPNDYVVFLCDLSEKFSQAPSFPKMIFGLYPNGFYADESLKKRVKWLKSNRKKLKKPELLDYLETDE